MDDALQCKCVRTNGTLSIILTGQWEFGATLSDAIKFASAIEWQLLVIDITGMTTDGNILRSDFVAQMVEILKVVRKKGAYWCILTKSSGESRAFKLFRLDTVFEPYIYRLVA